MKTRIKILLFIGITLCVLQTNAQVSFSCIYREYCEYNEYTEKFKTDCNGFEDVSLFVMNESETLFTHTTEEGKSTYYVTKKEYDTENDIYTYNAKSDVGNDYYFIFDLNNKEVKAVYMDDKEKTILLRFYVKAIF
ncbi:hypothetical protein [Tenacibaculum piscium]|uniref:hypothetical protein n=1 Tax=Tenacibaculum piscium TaxID=1458515 RepID=UPI001F3122B2|nr:hypothetical protein [Tenacibaculum piscium]